MLSTRWRQGVPPRLLRRAGAVLALALLWPGLAPVPAWAADRGADAILSPALPAASGARDADQASPLPGPGRADFGSVAPSPSVRQIADWAIGSGDHQDMPFVIVDKVNAKVFVFDASGRHIGHAPALLGLAKGDDSVPGIGQRKLSTIRPEERTTPAGRFVASLGKNLQGEEILWIDYEAAISMHRVITSNARERRAQRLDSVAVEDHRISYGCINVPVDFYNRVLSPAFTGTNGVVYVLPETRSAGKFFTSSDLEPSPSLGEAEAKARP